MNAGRGEGSPTPGRSLRRQATITLEPTLPFAFDATFQKPDHFPSQDTAWEPGVRWQTMRFAGQLLGLRIEDTPPRVRVGVWADRRVAQPLLDALADELIWRANLRLDLADFDRRARRDRLLASAVRRWRGMRPMHLGSLYEYLMIAIVLQNATVRRSVQMLQALLARYGTLVRFDRRELFGFWDPTVLAGATEQELRSLKVGYRARSLLRVSEAIAAGQLDSGAIRAATVEDQRAALLSLYGIGPASVGYILIDVFHASTSSPTSRLGSSGSIRACCLAPRSTLRHRCPSCSSGSRSGRPGGRSPCTTYGKTCSGDTVSSRSTG